MRRAIILAIGLTFVQAPISLAQAPTLGAPIPFEEPGRVERWWFTAESLLWWVKSSPMPVPLITLGDRNDLRPGALGQPGTRILYGRSNENLGAFGGGRFSAGLWFDDEQSFGFEGTGFFLAHRTQIFSASSVPRGSPVLTTPVFDAVNNREIAYFTTLPAIATGLTAVHNSTDLSGYDLNFVFASTRSANLQTDFLVGYRSLRLDESLSAFQVFSPLDTFAVTGLNVGTVPANKGDTISSFDTFSTRNQFNGAQLGTRYDWTRGRHFASMTVKLGLGAMHQTVNIDGGSLLINAKQQQNFVPGGILALPSNMGTYSRDVFAVVPEFTMNVGVNLSSRLRTFVGYNFVYVSNVARPGNQIDRTVNINNVPTDPGFGTPGGPARPAFSFHGSDYWSQGINFGLEFRF